MTSRNGMKPQCEINGCLNNIATKPSKRCWLLLQCKLRHAGGGGG